MPTQQTARFASARNSTKIIPGCVIGAMHSAMQPFVTLHLFSSILQDFLVCSEGVHFSFMIQKMNAIVKAKEGIGLELWQA